MQDADSAFRMHLDRLNELIRDGGSLSGHERNCAFLNTRGGRFANVSAVAGLDFADDARSPVIVDWDRDGDLDFWISNRTAPLVRFVRNDSPRRGSFVSVRLQGSSSNRDGIGARVEVIPAGKDHRPLLKTLHAGEGFLGQSSKWLHFGLGSAAKISAVRVRWPGGAMEEFQDVTAAGWYVLVQGRGRAESINRPVAAPPLVISPLEPLPPPSQTRTVLSARFPMPALRYTGFDGSSQQIQAANGRAVLINLWTSWCAPCIEELSAWKRDYDALKSTGIVIYAINADELRGDDRAYEHPAAGLVQRMELPFPTGVVTEALFRRLEQSLHWPFGRKFPLPVPTSFLLDGDGNLAVVYRGTLEVQQLKEDLKLLTASDESYRRASLPFAGRWDIEPQPRRPIQVAIQLMDKGDVADAAEFVRRNLELLAPHREFALLATWLGDEFSQTKRMQEALQFYDMAVRRDPSNLTVMNNFAWQLAANPDGRVRNPQLAVYWAEKAAAATNQRNPHVLDTLAVAYASAHKFSQAKETAEKARRIALSLGNRQLATKMTRRIELFENRQAYVEGTQPAANSSPTEP